MERSIVFVVISFLAICSLQAQKPRKEKPKDLFKRYTYIIEVSAKRKNGISEIFAMAVKVKNQNFLLTCLHPFYEVGLPGKNFSNYYIRSITGVEKKLGALRPKTNVYYVYVEDLDGNHSMPKCKVAKIDVKRDLALIEIPSSLELARDSGVDFLDITSDENYTRFRDSASESELSVIAPNFTNYSLECLELRTDLDNINMAGHLSGEMLEENNRIGIPDVDTAKAIKVYNSSVKHGASGGPVFSVTMNRLLAILWGGNSDYENIAIIPDFSAFVDTVSSEDSIKIQRAFSASILNAPAAQKSRVEFADKKLMEEIRWYFPYGVVTKNMDKDVNINEINSDEEIIEAAIIYLNDYMNKSRVKLRSSMSEQRLNAFCEKYSPAKTGVGKGSEGDRIDAFKRSYPVTAAFINLNGLLYRFSLKYSYKENKNFDEIECDSITKALQRLRDLLNSRDSITKNELKIWDDFGFRMFDYLERVSNYLYLKCHPDVSRVDTCQIALEHLAQSRQTKARGELREDYIDVCEKCGYLAYCDSAAGISSALSCDDLKKQCLKYARSFWESFYARYGRDFIMPSAVPELPVLEKNSNEELMIFDINVSKDLGAAMQNAWVDNYSISQRGLDNHNKIFEVLNDYIYGMTQILSPVLDVNYQHFLITGQADGIPYTKDFKPEPLLGDIDKEWVYMEGDNGGFIDSIQFKELTKPNSTPIQKNYALAFQRAMQFKQKLPNSDLTFTIPYHKFIKTRVSNIQGGAYRKVVIQMVFKLKKCN